MRTAEQSRLLATENYSRLEEEAREVSRKRDIVETPIQLQDITAAIDAAVDSGGGWTEIEVDWDMTVSAYSSLVQHGYEVRRTSNLAHKYVYQIRWDSARPGSNVQPEDVVAMPSWDT